MRNLIMLLVVTSAISGCKHTDTPITAAGSCQLFEVIRPSRQDVLTSGTKKQIVAHNRIWRENCEAKP
jgi:hypothetical protein